MKTRKITIEIPRPDLDFSNERTLRQQTKELAQDVAEQIVEYIQKQEQEEFTLTWRRIFRQWEIERAINEARLNAVYQQIQKKEEKEEKEQ